MNTADVLTQEPQSIVSMMYVVHAVEMLLIHVNVLVNLNVQEIVQQKLIVI